MIQQSLTYIFLDVHTDEHMYIVNFDLIKNDDSLSEFSHLLFIRRRS